MANYRQQTSLTVTSETACSGCSSTSFIGGAVSKPAFGCGGTVSTYIWWIGVLWPQVGSTVYTDQYMNNLLGAGHWPNGNQSGQAPWRVFTTNSSGVVTQVYDCGPN